MSATASQQVVYEAIPHLQTSPLHIRSIVVAIDFSEQSIWAAKYAAGLAKQLSGRLSLVHVVPEKLYIEPQPLLTADLEKFELARGRNVLHEFALSIPEMEAIPHEEIVLSGPAAAMIQEAAEEQKADLLVMGSHGRSGISKLALGSVAEAVIRNQHRPVLVAGPHCMRRYAPLESILLAVDLPVASLRAAQYAASIAQQSKVPLTAVHVVPNAGNLGQEKKLHRDLEALVPYEAGFAQPASFKVLHGEVTDKVLSAAGELRAGVIIMSAKDRSRMANYAPWTTLSRIIRDARCPVLAVPPHLR